ncbi:MAG: hypothetical protein OXR73_24505 [Myxococcales bacterium]|nr:hypothetical protein [Myxococcales bacterium]
MRSSSAAFVACALAACTAGAADGMEQAERQRDGGRASSESFDKSGDADVAEAGVGSGCGVPTPEDECREDMGCESGRRCACNARGGYSCVRAECFQDGDCGPNQRCRRDVQCQLPFGSFYCSSDQDECQSSDQCMVGVCHRSLALGYFVCELVPPCTAQ